MSILNSFRSILKQFDRNRFQLNKVSQEHSESSEMKETKATARIWLSPKQEATEVL